MTLNAYLTSKLFKEGLTVIDFCSNTGISRAAYYKYLTGERSPTPETLIKIANFLKINPLSIAAHVEPQPVGRPRSQRHKIGRKIHKEYDVVIHKKQRARLKQKYMAELKKLLEKDKKDVFSDK